MKRKTKNKNHKNIFERIEEKIVEYSPLSDNCRHPSVSSNYEVYKDIELIPFPDAYLGILLVLQNPQSKPTLRKLQLQTIVEKTPIFHWWDICSTRAACFHKSILPRGCLPDHYIFNLVKSRIKRCLPQISTWTVSLNL